MLTCVLQIPLQEVPSQELKVYDVPFLYYKRLLSAQFNPSFCFGYSAALCWSNECSGAGGLDACIINELLILYLDLFSSCSAVHLVYSDSLAFFTHDISITT